MNIQVISLERTPERFREFQEDNPAFRNIQRTVAVDGNMLDRQILIDKGFIDPTLHYKNGAIGCALSHIAIWTNTLKTGGFCTIFEDDAVINEGFEQESQRLIETLPDDWDIVLWGFNTDAYMTFSYPQTNFFCTAQFDHNNLVKNKDQFRTQPIHPMLFKLIRAHGTIGYSISISGIKRLLGHTLPLRPMQTFYPGLQRFKDNTGIDDMMAHVYDKLNAWVSFPPLVLAKNDLSKSTVQNG